MYLGRTDGDVQYDFANYAGLEYANFIKFVGLDNGGGSWGYDLDAVEALNSGRLSSVRTDSRRVLAVGFRSGRPGRLAEEGFQVNLPGKANGGAIRSRRFSFSQRRTGSPPPPSSRPRPRRTCS